MKIGLCRVAPHALKPAPADNLFVIPPVHAHNARSAHLIGNTGLFRYRWCIGDFHQYHLTLDIDVLVGCIIPITYINQLKDLAFRFGRADMGTGQAVNFHCRIEHGNLGIHRIAVVGIKLFVFHLQSILAQPLCHIP